MEKWDNFAFRLPAITSRQTFRSASGSLAMLAAILRASSRERRLAADPARGKPSIARPSMITVSNFIQTQFVKMA